MVTTICHATSIKVCPRCSHDIPGWLINESGYVHCASCGLVVRDPGFVGADFKGLFANFEKKPSPPESVAKWHPDKIVDNHTGLALIAYSMTKCCQRHNGQTIHACATCKKRYDELCQKKYRGERVTTHDIQETIMFLFDVE